MTTPEEIKPMFIIPTDADKQAAIEWANTPDGQQVLAEAKWLIAMLEQEVMSKSVERRLAVQLAPNPQTEERNVSEELKIEAPIAYAWEFSNPPVLCRWAEPEYAALQARSKPSPEANIRQVRIIRERDYRRLLKAAKRRETVDGHETTH